MNSLQEKPLGLLLWALFLGLIFGLIEVALLGVAKFALHRELHVGKDVVWMAPMALALVFAVPAILLSMVSRRWPGIVTARIAVFGLTFLGFLDLLVMYQRLHAAAAVLLAAGLASQATRLIIRYEDSARVVASYGLAVLAGGFIVLAAGLHGWSWLMQERAMRELAPPSAGAPNVLMIVLDTVRARNLSIYGYERRTTPNLERIFAHGVVFDRAISPAPWTLPSHATMFTGHFLNELSTHWDHPLDDAYPTLAEMLKSNGYLTAGFVANTHFCSYEMGLDRGFIHYEDYMVSAGEFIRSSSLVRTITNSDWFKSTTGYHQVLGRKSASQINRRFLDWLSTHGHRPFFVFLNYFDAHQPYLPPGEFREKFSPALAPAEGHGTLEGVVSKEELDREIYAYDSSIAALDQQLGLLVDDLRDRDLLQNTVMVLTSDHGEEFGEHALFSHGNSLYVDSLHVPLMIAFPGRVPVGKRVPEPVTTRDIGSTILSLVRVSGHSPLPGVSLERYWDQDASRNGLSSPVLSEVNYAKNLPEWFPVSRGNMKALMDGPLRYIRNGDGKEEVYDLQADPRESQNLIGTEYGRRTARRLGHALDQIQSGHSLDPD